MKGEGKLFCFSSKVVCIVFFFRMLFFLLFVIIVLVVYFSLGNIYYDKFFRRLWGNKRK